MGSPGVSLHALGLGSPCLSPGVPTAGWVGGFERVPGLGVPSDTCRWGGPCLPLGVPTCPGGWRSPSSARGPCLPQGVCPCVSVSVSVSVHVSPSALGVGGARVAPGMSPTAPGVGGLCLPWVPAGGATSALDGGGAPVLGVPACPRGGGLSPEVPACPWHWGALPAPLHSLKGGLPSAPREGRGEGPHLPQGLEAPKSTPRRSLHAPGAEVHD